ncbi:MAG: DnaJ domain-containing protein, partial [Deltaproteobacteria bacterium]|nr:DnaJ domain-containing protein [Candidatus Tharpella sp.]
MTKPQRENIGRLIEKISRRTSTENLIAFVADNFGMLLACQKVVDFKENPAAGDRRWFEQKCRDFRILPQILEKECERLLSIFQPGLAQDEQYSLLGLTPLASIAEVKSAYHKLSFRYHPDSAAAAASGDQDNSEKFIAICRAYKKITQAQETLNAGVDAENIPWQKEFRPRISKRRQQKRKAFFLITAIAACLLIISFSATRSYRNRAMLKSLGQSSGTAAVKSRPQPVAVAVAPEIKAKPEKPVQVAAASPAPRPLPDPAKDVSELPRPQKIRKSKSAATIQSPVKKTSPEKITPKAKPLPSVTRVKKTVLPKPVPVDHVSESLRPRPKPVQPVPVTPPSVPVKVAAVASTESLKIAVATPPSPKVHKVKKTAPPVPVKVAVTIPPAPIVVSVPKAKPIPKPVKVAAVAAVKMPTPAVLPLRDRVNSFLSAYTDTYR